ncbi:hypothetical protein PI124_g6829 [Phytophthora idaei]|nr:hypothetical protein PI125_g6508 [Phytophthora idaei]KAG3114342.1 hypothetical protein PI125_g6507 [Phytophthora idaei]KAG3163040.1 hypothetical protein PI126_g5706 [Phytophthora idaei]KAG3163043.1 hypothetical protein PI126_g5705 [Phytophthora idaei]KAG3248478.1 hypothetical protein PI124_g6830 [Phytophthora idaei]
MLYPSPLVRHTGVTGAANVEQYLIDATLATVVDESSVD